MASQIPWFMPNLNVQDMSLLPPFQDTWRPPVQVTWRPPQTYLHYDQLYRGIYEYLRAPPDHQHRAVALHYLHELRASRSNDNYLQDHRIRWVEEWLKALPDDRAECSGADTDVEEEEWW